METHALLVYETEYYAVCMERSSPGLRRTPLEKPEAQIPVPGA